MSLGLIRETKTEHNTNNNYIKLDLSRIENCVAILN